MTPAFVKFIGLEQAAAKAIEEHRLSSDETESVIIERVMGRHVPEIVPNHPAPDQPLGGLEIGQGISLNVGETAYLFLSKSDALSNRPAATAFVRPEGLELDGKVFVRERGSFVQRPMRHVQDKVGHVGAEGKAVSLSAYRQWHVVRNGRMVSLETLKAPEKARQRRTNLNHLSADELLERLGLVPPP